MCLEVKILKNKGKKPQTPIFHRKPLCSVKDKVYLTTLKFWSIRHLDYFILLQK